MISTFTAMAASLLLGQIESPPIAPQPTPRVYVYSNGVLVPLGDAQRSAVLPVVHQEADRPILSKIQGWFGKSRTETMPAPTTVAPTTVAPMPAPRQQPPSRPVTAPAMPPAKEATQSAAPAETPRKLPTWTLFTRATAFSRKTLTSPKFAKAVISGLSAPPPGR